MAYYYAALNNGAGMVVILDWPYRLHHFRFFIGEGVRYFIAAAPQRDFLESLRSSLFWGMLIEYYFFSSRKRRGRSGKASPALEAPSAVRAANVQS